MKIEAINTGRHSVNVLIDDVVVAALIGDQPGEVAAKLKLFTDGIKAGAKAAHDALTRHVHG